MATINGYPESILDDPEHEAWQTLLGLCDLFIVDYDVPGDPQHEWKIRDRGIYCEIGFTFLVNGVGWRWRDAIEGGFSYTLSPLSRQKIKQLMIINGLGRIIKDVLAKDSPLKEIIIIPTDKPKTPKRGNEKYFQNAVDFFDALRLDE